MSLDLTIESRTPVRHRGTGVFVREGGMTRNVQNLVQCLVGIPYGDYDQYLINSDT